MPLIRRCPWLTRRTELRMAGACLPLPAGWAAGEACPRGPGSPAPRAAAGRAPQLLAVSLAPRSPAAPPGPACPPPAARARAPRPRQPPRPAPTTAPTTSTTSSTQRKSPPHPYWCRRILSVTIHPITGSSSSSTQPPGPPGKLLSSSTANPKRRPSCCSCHILKQVLNVKRRPRPSTDPRLLAGRGHLFTTSQ